MSRRGRTARRRSPSARRLRRLRWQVTVLSALFSVVSLSVLALIVSATDGQLRRGRLDEAVRLPVVEAVADVGFDADGQPYFTQDRASQVYVFLRNGDDYTAAIPTIPPDLWWAPLRPDYGEIPADQAAQIAFYAMLYETEWTGDIDVGWTVLRALARPVVWDESFGPIGAVLGVIDPQYERSDHRELVTTVWIGGGLVAVVSSIIGFLLAGRSIRPAARAVEQQERLLADAAHELRTPVASVRAVAEAALAGAAPAEDAIARTAQIAERTSGLVDDLLTLARMDAGQQSVQKEPLRLDLLVEEVLSDHEAVVFTGEEVTVHADAQLLRRAVDNLLRNAFRHGADATGHAEVEVTVRASGGRAQVVVADRGMGIEPGLLPHLFERFRSGRRSGASGLGLSIVEWVATAHGGKVTGDSRTDGGAVFTFSLPR